AAGSLALAAAIWGWVAAQPRGSFHDQGGMLITLVILPWTLALWVAGGPVALVLGSRALGRGRADSGGPAGRGVARAGVVLSGLIVVGGLGYVAVIVASMAR